LKPSVTKKTTTKMLMNDDIITLNLFFLVCDKIVEEKKGREREKEILPSIHRSPAVFN
jgi:hypothetical protein